MITATGPNIPTILGIGGAKGGGKSRMTRDIALLALAELGNNISGIVITIVRRVYKDLSDNHIEPLFRERPELRIFWRAGRETLDLPNGSHLVFRYAETEDDVKRKFLGGYESAIIFVDEAQQFSETELKWIQTACRWTDPGGIPENLCKLVLLFNPGGAGSAYIRRIFWTRQYEGFERAGAYAFIHLFGWDNFEWFRGQIGIEETDFYKIPSRCDGGLEPASQKEQCCRFHLFITQTTEGRKYWSFPMSIRAGYLLGSFDHFEGQYFDSSAWDSSLIVISPAKCQRIIQPWWTRWMAMDWGWAGGDRPHYSVNLWAAVGKLSPAQLEEHLGIISEVTIDAVIVYRSRHANRTPEEQWAQIVVDATPIEERRTIGRHFVDGAVFSTDRHSANTTADLMRPVFEDAGFPNLERADKDRIGGWRQLYNAFVRTCNARRMPVTEELDQPIFLISAECPELARAIPLLICDPDRPEDVLKTETMEDDYSDCLRYLWKSMMGAQWKAPIAVRREETYNSYIDPMRPRTGGDVTNAMLALRRFDASERRQMRRRR